MNLTPAETLRITKRRKRPKRNPPAESEPVLWVNNLRELREAHDLSMADVAKAVRLSTGSYFRIENGYADVKLSNATAIARFFGRTITMIWKEWKGPE